MHYSETCVSLIWCLFWCVICVQLIKCWSQSLVIHWMSWADVTINFSIILRIKILFSYIIVLSIQLIMEYFMKWKNVFYQMHKYVPFNYLWTIICLMLKIGQRKICLFKHSLRCLLLWVWWGAALVACCESVLMYCERILT